MYWRYTGVYIYYTRISNIIDDILLIKRRHVSCSAFLHYCYSDFISEKQPNPVNNPNSVFHVKLWSEWREDRGTNGDGCAFTRSVCGNTVLICICMHDVTVSHIHSCIQALRYLFIIVEFSDKQHFQNGRPVCSSPKKFVVAMILLKSDSEENRRMRRALNKRIYLSEFIVSFERWRTGYIQYKYFNYTSI